MVYNMDFLISSLIFLLLILLHFLGERKLDDYNSRSFLIFALIGLADVFFDILCTILISADEYALLGVTKVCMTILYMLQVVVPFALLFYTQSLRNCSIDKKKRFLKFWMIPTIIMLLAVFLNNWYGYFFYFDQAGRYIRGTLYLAMYAYAGVITFVIAYSSFKFYKELGARKFGTLWEFLLIMGISVAIQARFNDILMTGFGIGMGIVVMFLTINNPYEYTDNLTGTYDSQYFSKWVQGQMDRGKKLHLITVDLFRLKSINKLRGSSFGNQILIQTAKALRSICGSRYIFRIGGNRFLMAVDSLYEYECMRNNVREYFDKEMQIPVIIGGIMNAEELKESDALLGYIEYMVSLSPEREGTILIQSAEETLRGFYYSKEIEMFLQQAIKEDLFEVYYQPVYSLDTGKYVTLEALSRLRHPSLGPVSPELFISLAEKNGQIADIGLLQFRKICRFVKEHKEMMKDIKNIKVNMSPAELLKQEYSKQIVEMVKEYDLCGSYFQFEITETVATDYSDKLFEIVQLFGDEGIEICLDDFGSGYANLNTVLKLPFSAIKLDRSLLQGVEDDPQIAQFYQNIVSVLQSIGYSVIAEGVETEEELKLVSKWGVNMVQGYYFSRPVDETEILKLL